MVLRPLAILLPCLVLAQEFRATLSGRITDPSGGAVPGVVVVVRHTGTNEAVNAITGPQGDFTAPFLRPGSYSISVEASGFKKAVR
ncbi:MAG: carboxypeptidase regulatory-like domain-containing protein [Bryobacteraceae bacterium]|nr:carboxypeptidase regulatory-like domain-containing protein [Bryobacteraceae bacterium]